MGLGWLCIIGSRPAPTSPVGVIKPPAGGKIRPSVPFPRFDLIEVIVIADDIPRPALINTVLGCEEPTIQMKGYAVGVAQTPCHNFEAGAIRVAPEDGAIALDVAKYDLAGARFRPKRHKSAGMHLFPDVTQNVLELIVMAS